MASLRFASLVALAASVCAFPPVAVAQPSSTAITPATTTAAPPGTKLAGKVERVTVHGVSLVGNLAGDSPDRFVSVYLPASYATSPTKRFPVLYLLHGFTDRDDQWFGLAGQHFVNAPVAADRAFSAGTRELILVMPNAYNQFAGSMYSNSVVTGDWETFVAKDLVAYVDQHYRTIPERAARGLAGHSMGGYGVAKIGMKYSDVFSSLYAMSPCCMAPNMDPNAVQMERAAQVKTVEDIAKADFGTKAMLASAAAWSANPRSPPLLIDLPVVDGKRVPATIAKWAANAPLTMVHQYIPQLRSYTAIAFDAGDMDTGIAGTVQDLHQILTDYGLSHSFEIYPGNHTNRIDERLTSKVLPFFSAHLKF